MLSSPNSAWFLLSWYLAWFLPDYSWGRRGWTFRSPLGASRRSPLGNLGLCWSCFRAAGWNGGAFAWTLHLELTEAVRKPLWVVCWRTPKYTTVLQVYAIAIPVFRAISSARIEPHLRAVPLLDLSKNTLQSFDKWLWRLASCSFSIRTCLITRCLNLAHSSEFPVAKPADFSNCCSWVRVLEVSSNVAGVFVQ